MCCGGPGCVVEDQGGLWRTRVGCGGPGYVVEDQGGLWRTRVCCGGPGCVVEDQGVLWRTRVCCGGPGCVVEDHRGVVEDHRGAVEVLVNRSTPILFTIVRPAAGKQANIWYSSEGELRVIVFKFESYTGVFPLGHVTDCAGNTELEDIHQLPTS